MEYFGKAKTATEQTKIANAKEEIELEILNEIARANLENNKLNYENIWNNLRKKDENLDVDSNSDNSYNVFYKDYNFIVDSDNKVTYIETINNPNKDKTEMISLGSVTIDGITYVDSYEIWNKAQLENFRNRVNNGETFENCIICQRANINLNSENWVPIGNMQNTFNGRYNGKNHKITGINVDNGSSVQGLFGAVQGQEQQYAIVENLTVEGEVKGTFYVGGVAGIVSWTTVRNCVNKVSVFSTGRENNTGYTADMSGTGGIVGYVARDGGEVINCKNYGTITSVYAGMAGIVGWSGKADIKECINYVDINNRSMNYVAGITGWIEEGKIEKCCNTGKIEGRREIGGICGTAGYRYQGLIKTVKISKVNNTGEISGEYIIGGVVGDILDNSTIEQSSNNGHVYATDADTDKYASVGGVVGYTFGDNITVSYCYNTGNIESEWRGVGGVVGTLRVQTGFIEYCYNIGDVTNKNTAGYNGCTGGIWGFLERTPNNITNCWQLVNCVKGEGVDTDQTNVEEKTEDEIKAINWGNYKIVAGKNGGYPILEWES